ncbi:MAG: EutN/CcmL family microcompartment protein [Spirochaetia bacterium]|jgi:ethanolamine utilization protein EutN|nr:EutN/CcmL family microcompartment protein [Spirochaetia bacterium]
MTLARVTGTVVCTVKVEALEGLKLMIVHPINPTGELIGKQMVAVDSLQSGIGDDVLIIDEGGSAGIMLDMSSKPIRTVIAAIVDRVDLVNEEKNVR